MMGKSLRVDHFPKNGKTSATPKVANITASKAPRIAEGKGENMPEMRNKPKPALATANKSGEGYKKPSFGITSGDTYAKGKSSTAVPRGSNEIHGGHPKSHAAFHALGNPKGGKY